MATPIQRQAQRPYRGMAPITMRSAQGSAATGRYVSGQGAVKILGSGYPAMDAPAPSPAPAPAPRAPAGPIQAQTTSDDAVATPAGENSLQVDPAIEQAVGDVLGSTAKTVGMNAGLPFTAGVLAGYPAGMVAPAVIGPALMAAPQMAMMATGLKAVNEGVPSAYAKVRDMLNERGYNSPVVDAYRDEAGNLDVGAMPSDLVNDAAASIADQTTRSRPLTEQFSGMIGNVMSPVGGWLDENVVQPTKSFLGFDDAQKQGAVEGLDKAALDEDANTPDFAMSDYDHQLQANEEKQMADMRAREQQTRERERQDALAKAERLARDIAGRPNSDMRGDGGLYNGPKHDSHVSTKDAHFGGAGWRFGGGRGAGMGSAGHTSTGGGGGLAGRSSDDTGMGSNPGGFGKDSGGGGRGKGAGSNGGRGGAGNN